MKRWKGISLLLLAVLCAGFLLFSNHSLPAALAAGRQTAFVLVNSAFAAGAGAAPSGPAQYQARAALGENGLPANQAMMGSAHYQHQPGFLAADPPEPRYFQFLPAVKK